MVLLAGCARGIGTGEGDEDITEVGGNDGVGGEMTTSSGGMGGSPTGTGGDPTGTGGSATGMPGTGGMGGDPGPTCNPPEHLCGGICTGNTPATGCYQSQTCQACPNVANGTAICDGSGNCAASCNSPYVPSGNTCVCPSQCCSNADCGGNDTCENGTCVTPCDQAACIALCIIQMSPGGVCINNQCVCI